jgi:hypothetical protein
MTKITDRTGKGSAINTAENDANLSSLSGINAPITATTHTIDINDQNDTIEYSNASAIAVTLPSIASVTGANLHTDDFKVTLKNIGAGTVTVTRGSTDTFEDASTSIALLQYETVTIQTDSSLTKWNIISPSNLNGVTASVTEINTLVGNTLKTKVINIGDWDMDVTSFLGVAHGLTVANIRSVSAMIRDDAGANNYPLVFDADSDGVMDGAVYCAVSNVVMTRVTAGFFDSVDFNATSYNRGWIVIQYV